MNNLRKAAEMALEALMQKGEHHPKVYQAAEALRQAIAQQKLSDSIRPKGKSITKVWVDEINQTLEQPEQEQDRQIDQLIQERDHRDEIIDKLCDAVLGPDRYEWSSQYFFEDAVREVEERMAALEQPAQQEQGDSVCQEDGGCPTELAVLQRFWRGQSIPDEHYPAWFKPAQQEPVAWQVHPFDYGIGHEGVYARTDRPEQVEMWKRKGWTVQPLYTTPPAAQRDWVGLTDAEIGIVSADIWGSVLIAPQSYQAFARAIEAKLKEKNT